MKKIKKALITCAGFGTRLLPITKTIQKEMLPILNRPMIDYLIEDCVKAGIEEIVFVINKHNYQVLHYYRENQRLYHYLKDLGKLELYEKIAHLHQQARFHFVKQDDTDGYGTAVPLKLAKDHFKNEEAFLVLMGDDFLYNPKINSPLQAMLSFYYQSQADGLITCFPKPDSELHLYGVAQVIKKANFDYLEKLIEKPAPGEAPSNLINISKYILCPDVFDIIENQSVNAQSGELYITDSVSQLANSKQLVIYQPDAQYLDTGNTLNWLKANLLMAKHDQQLYQDIKEFITQEF